ncbi:hypothetical protein BaRGS_00011819 [Batillaria attramentaria]|uniref:Uncharacterized protein n=1 Tax=Batillaria attramentaria TaxID=370345 RepID=A0ABD0LCY7_9CAEN
MYLDTKKSSRRCCTLTDLIRCGEDSSVLLCSCHEVLRCLRLEQTGSLSQRANFSPQCSCTAHVPCTIYHDSLTFGGWDAGYSSSGGLKICKTDRRWSSTVRHHNKMSTVHAYVRFAQDAWQS